MSSNQPNTLLALPIIPPSHQSPSTNLPNLPRHSKTRHKHRDRNRPQHHHKRTATSLLLQTNPLRNRARHIRFNLLDRPQEPDPADPVPHRDEDGEDGALLGDVAGGEGVVGAQGEADDLRRGAVDEDYGAGVDREAEGLGLHGDDQGEDRGEGAEPELGCEVGERHHGVEDLDAVVLVAVGNAEAEDH